MSKFDIQQMIDQSIAIAMSKHNRNATLISMALGLICLAAFVDGLLRVLGVIPPFLDIDISVINKIKEKILN